MANPIPFFEPINIPNEKGCSHAIGKTADIYISWKGQRYTWINNSYWARSNDRPSSATLALKIFTAIFTLGLLPLIAVIIKSAYRKSLFDRIKKDLREETNTTANKVQTAVTNVPNKSVGLPTNQPKIIETPEKNPIINNEFGKRKQFEELKYRVECELPDTLRDFDNLYFKANTNQKLELNRLKKEAEQFYSEYVVTLGTFYQQGHGVAKNEQEAARWFTIGVEKKNPIAMLLLSDMYATGKGGIRKNIDEAKKLLHQVLAIGDKEDKQRAFDLLFSLELEGLKPHIVT